MKGSVFGTPKIPVILGKILLGLIFTKADLTYFANRFVWYACQLQLQTSMDSSVDFFESLINEDGRFAEVNNCQEPSQRRQRPRPRPLAEGSVVLQIEDMTS